MRETDLSLPIRTKQQKAQSASFAILLYQLRELGIFRNVTENDYGIDFEIEWVQGEVVTGKTIKAQVKSAESIKLRGARSVPSVSGIKQSTLHYWTEISRQAPVIAYAVDLTTECVYVSQPLFWQASQLVDNSQATKTIRLLPMKNGLETTMASIVTLMAFCEPSLADTLHMHRTALRRLSDFLNLYVDVEHYDGGMPLQDPDALHVLLETCRILLWRIDLTELGFSNAEAKSAYSFDFWREEWGDVSNYRAIKPVHTLMPALIDRLVALRREVLKGLYYWIRTDRSYLQLVHDTQLPLTVDKAMLREWGYHLERLVPAVRTDVDLIASGVIPIDPALLA